MKTAFTNSSPAAPAAPPSASIQSAKEQARALLLAGMKERRTELVAECADLQQQARQTLEDALGEVEDGTTDGAAFVGFHSQVVAVLRAEDLLRIGDRCIAFIEGAE